MALNKRLLLKRISKRLPNHIFNELVRSNLIRRSDVAKYGKRRLLTMLNEEENDFVKRFLILRYFDVGSTQRVLEKYGPHFKFSHTPIIRIKNGRFKFYDYNYDKYITPPRRKIDLRKTVAIQNLALMDKVMETPTSYKAGTFAMEMISVMNYIIRLIRYLARYVLKEAYAGEYKSPDGHLETPEEKEVADKRYIEGLNSDIRPHLNEILDFIPSLSETAHRFNDPELMEDIDALNNHILLVMDSLNTIIDDDERWLGEEEFTSHLLYSTKQIEWHCENIKSRLFNADFKSIDISDLHPNKNLPAFNSKFMISSMKSYSASSHVLKYSRDKKQW